ncbi:MAG: replication factor C large subunit, partial [DPANN group archaeon]|nr:replication factor C large subunit [DPANN group archaeon]
EELNCELVEMNASQFRDAGSVQTILGPATKQASLFGGKKIILVDDVDSMSGQKDRGGPAEIA